MNSKHQRIHHPTPAAFVCFSKQLLKNKQFLRFLTLCYKV